MADSHLPGENTPVLLKKDLVNSILFCNNVRIFSFFSAWFFIVVFPLLSFKKTQYRRECHLPLQRESSEAGSLGGSLQSLLVFSWLTSKNNGTFSQRKHHLSFLGSMTTTKVPDTCQSGAPLELAACVKKDTC